MAEVEGFAGGELLVNVVECDFADDSAELEGERGVRSDAAAAADNADLHVITFKLWPLGRIVFGGRVS